MIGEIASKKWRFAPPVRAASFSARAGDVSGPVATTITPSAGRSVFSSRTTLMRELPRIASVTLSPKAVLSTTSALPPGMAQPSAASMMREPSTRNSALRRPCAFPGSFDFNELEQTSSARRSVLWAGVFAAGRIS